MPRKCATRAFPGEDQTPPAQRLRPLPLKGPYLPCRPLLRFYHPFLRPLPQSAFALAGYYGWASTRLAHRHVVDPVDRVRAVDPRDFAELRQCRGGSTPQCCAEMTRCGSSGFLNRRHTHRGVRNADRLFPSPSFPIAAQDRFRWEAVPAFARRSGGILNGHFRSFPAPISVFAGFGRHAFLAMVGPQLLLRFRQGRALELASVEQAINRFFSTVDLRWRSGW